MEFIGVDFSGNTRSWRATCAKPNVWLCRINCDGALRPLINDLRSVQNLAGDGTPFQRLARIFSDGQFGAAAIDAPFSLPARHAPKEGWLKLLELVDALPLARETPFPSGPSLIALAQSVADLECQKPFRRTEKFWLERNINVRSTLWWKPRGGAAFAAACMKLLAQAKFPACWPWSGQTNSLVVEAFPAAQLWAWNLPFQKYDGVDGADRRQQIIRGLKPRINFGQFEKIAAQSATATRCHRPRCGA